jgi:(E)-4-hydroxy-3-methylbut-2-enyl-diphosphate synthase
MPLGPHLLGGTQPVLVEVPLGASPADDPGVRRELDAEAGVRVPEETRAEVVSVELSSATELEALESMRRSIELVAPRVALSATIDPAWLERTPERWAGAAHRLHLRFNRVPGSDMKARLDELIPLTVASSTALLLEAGGSDPEDAVDLALELAGSAASVADAAVMVALTPTEGYSPLHATRLLAARLHAAELDLPILLLDRPAERGAEPLLAPATALGGLLCDGIGDAIQIRHPSPTDSRRLAFGILQGARVRITKTEFISCPSCGRTLFDLEETTARIKAHTSHLKGLKIAVMGCIVNGPGEMADADFGYVGWGEDKIALFVGKEMVARDIPTDEAHLRLIDLIKANGRWIDP